MTWRGSKPSLQSKILLSTAFAITLLMALAGWFVQDQTRSVLSQNLQSEVAASFGAYQALWKSRAATLRSVSLVMSSMSDVRAAFGTRDQATISDTAGEIWSRVSASNALFLVTDPGGRVIASLGGGQVLGNDIDVVREAAPRFPAQTDGFALENGKLYELVVTPVYVQTPGGQALLNVLVAGFPVDLSVAEELKMQTGGSDFVFVANGMAIASTLSSERSHDIARQYRRGDKLQRMTLAGADFAVLGSPLPNVEGFPAGDLLVVRTFDSIRRNLDPLLIKLVLIWAAAILASLGVAGFLAHRILKPIHELDEAAALIARQEYGTRVAEGGNDELGRLARTFNAMCMSIQGAREELIRQERISTIGRLSSSIVHDLRNPLASIYGGAEMMVDGNLSESQFRRIAANIYRSSRVINDLLQELVNVSRGRNQAPEVCKLSDVIGAGVDAQTSAAEQQHVTINALVDPSLELPMERARVERVFVNLIGNAIEAMPDGGSVEIRAERNGDHVLVSVDDTGPGIPPSVRDRLFQPFVSGSRHGLGLGLALSRQTILDQGGDLWAEATEARGARFRIKLPLPA